MQIKTMLSDIGLLFKSENFLSFIPATDNIVKKHKDIDVQGQYFLDLQSGAFYSSTVEIIK